MKPKSRYRSLRLFRFSIPLVFALILVLPNSLRAQNPIPDDFNPGASGGGIFGDTSVYSLAVQADGKILVGGLFTTLGAQPRSNMGRLNANGTLDTAFNPGADTQVYSLALQTDGKILVGGFFTTLGGQPRNYIGRLNSDGTPDPVFDPGTDSPVYSLAVQADGKILVGGDFTTMAGQTRNRIGRLNTNGTLDTTFNPGATGGDFPFVSCLAVQADGKILVGGEFTTLGGQVRSRIGRLNANGSLDTAFNPGASGDPFGPVFSLAVQADGKILVGGGFTTLGGQPRERLGRLNTNGTLDAAFNPGADEMVVSLAVQTDGKILAGGYFTTLGGQPRSYLGRLNGDGTPDTAFTPEADSLVDTLTVQGDGMILVGGQFATLGGQPRSSIGRLNNTDPATQSLSYAGSTISWLRGGSSPEVWQTTFEHSANGLVWTNLGTGTRIPGGWQRAGVSLPPGRSIRARGYVTGVQNAGWFVEAYHGLPSLLSQPVSRTNDFGATSSFQVAASGAGSLIYQWLKNGAALVDQGNTAGANSPTLTLSPVSNADEGGYSVVVSNDSGSVTSVVATLTVRDPLITLQPVSRNRNPGTNVTFSVAATGTPPLNYQWYHDGIAVPGATDSSLTLQDLSKSDAGFYTAVASNADGSDTSAAALLTINAVTVDNGFNPGANASVLALAVQADGRILVGGGFTNLSGEARNRIARLNADGTLDSNFNPGSSGGLFGSVQSLAIQTDGKILVGGSFDTLGGLIRLRLGRLNPDGTLDSTFNPGVSSFFDLFTEVETMAVQADGKILVGGVFDTLGGGERINVGRLNANGTLDGSFNPGRATYDNSQPVQCLAVQTDGKILVGGTFTELGRQARTNIGRLTASGALDTTFNPGADGEVLSLAVQADGKILVGGSFTSLGGQNRNCIGRLNTNGTLDATFNPGASGGDLTLGSSVHSLAVQADGKILVGGNFTTLGGQPRNRIARLHADGTLDGTFNPGAGNVVRSLAVQADGKILVGGNFATLGGQPHSGVGRLNNTDPATQDLGYAGTTITWLRGGAGPEVWHTTFEHSADGLAWTSIGAGTRIPGGWQRTGVSLPAGRALRARGQVAGGFQNASGWFVEGYYGKPVILSQPASRTNGAAAPAIFAVVVAGTEPLTYQWLKNETALLDQGNTSGARSSTLTLSQVLKADEGAYRAVVSNSFGSVTSLVANLTVLNPLITRHPVGAQRNAGETVTFNVTAIGTPSLSYQWYQDGVLLQGAVESSLTLPGLSRGNAGVYTVTVSNLDGSVSSTPALLIVNLATVDGTFNPEAGGGYLGQVHALAVQADGKILVGGDFTSLDGRSYENLGRLNADGTLDEAFNPGASGGDSFTSAAVYSLAVQPDGKILVGGSFDTLGGGIRHNLGRLDASGTLEGAFNPGTSGGDSFFGTYVYSLAMQANGKILVGGDFTTLGGQTRSRIGRLNPDGTLDTAFNPGANDQVLSLAVQPDGKILVGGAFTTLGGQARARIGRLNTNGTLDATFNPGASGGDRGEVHSLAVQADGKILVGGDFTILRGQTRTNLGRLNSDGTLDGSFNPGANAGIYFAYVYSLAVQADGKILVGGDFTTLGGQSRVDLGRLNADGTLDSTFTPIGGPGKVLSLSVQPDGETLVGGYFDILAGQSRSRIAKLINTDPHIETLGYGGSTITWLRGGTSPEVSRTAFEHSVDGLAWTDLGAGARIPGGWQKTGVSLPPNGTLRARGQVSGGDEGSGWFTETILDLTPVIHLSLVRDASSVTLSWTGGQGPYQVQQSTDASQPASWQDVGGPVQNNLMSLPIGPDTLFLRVRGN